MKTRTIIAGQRLTVGLAAKALLASLLSIGLLVASATTANAAPAPDLTPFWVKTPSRVVAGQQVYFDSGIRNWGDKGTGVFNIKWLVDGKEVGAYGSHEGIPGHSSKLNGNTQFSWTFTDPGSNHRVTFIVDADNHVAENSERNNRGFTDIWVRPS